MTASDLSAWRKRLGLTQARAAELFGVSIPTWKRWESKGPAYPVMTQIVCDAIEARPKAG